MQCHDPDDEKCGRPFFGVISGYNVEMGLFRKNIVNFSGRKQNSLNTNYYFERGFLKIFPITTESVVSFTIIQCTRVGCEMVNCQ